MCSRTAEQIGWGLGGVRKEEEEVAGVCLGILFC